MWTIVYSKFNYDIGVNARTVCGSLSILNGSNNKQYYLLSQYSYIRMYDARTEVHTTDNKKLFFGAISEIFSRGAASLATASIIICGPPHSFLDRSVVLVLQFQPVGVKNDTATTTTSSTRNGASAWNGASSRNDDSSEQRCPSRRPG